MIVCVLFYNLQVILLYEIRACVSLASTLKIPFKTCPFGQDECDHAHLDF